MDGWVYAGKLLDGASRRTTNIEVSSVGVGIGPFKRTMYPWSLISDVAIDGPSSKTSRITATRLATLGVFALAAKKSTAETLVIITLTSGQIITVMFLRKSEPEVHAIFTPHLGRIPKLAEPVATISPCPISSESQIEQLKDLSELLEKGMIDNQEFLDLKSKILHHSAMPTAPAPIDTAAPVVTVLLDEKTYQKGLQFINSKLLSGEHLVGKIQGIIYVNPSRQRFGCIVVTNHRLHFRGNKLAISFEKQITETFNLSAITDPVFIENAGLMPGSEMYGESAKFSFNYNERSILFWLLIQTPRGVEDNLSFKNSFFSAYELALASNNAESSTNEIGEMSDENGQPGG